MNSAQFITEAHEYSKGKVCANCKEHKSLSEFSKKIDSKDGIRLHCKSCVKEYNDNMDPFVKWFSYRKGGAKVKGKEFTIEPDNIPGVKVRSEERRVGKECRSRWSPYH